MGFVWPQGRDDREPVATAQVVKAFYSKLIVLSMVLMLAVHVTQRHFEAEVQAVHRLRNSSSRGLVVHFISRTIASCATFLSIPPPLWKHLQT